MRGGVVSSESAVHLGQIDRGLAGALVDAGLARNGRIDLSHEVDRRWLVMSKPLVAVYSSVLAENFALANKLVPTTDQSDAYAATTNWSAAVIAGALLGDGPERPRPTSDAPVAGEIVALLALDFVVPADLDRVPAARIVEIRRRFGPVAVNVKTQLPSAAAFAGGPLLTGHPRRRRHRRGRPRPDSRSPRIPAQTRTADQRGSGSELSAPHSRSSEPAQPRRALTRYRTAPQRVGAAARRGCGAGIGKPVDVLRVAAMTDGRHGLRHQYSTRTPRGARAGHALRTSAITRRLRRRR